MFSLFRTTKQNRIIHTILLQSKAFTGSILRTHKSLKVVSIFFVTFVSFSKDDGIIAEVIEGENKEREDDQEDEKSMTPTRLSTNRVKDTLETPQDHVQYEQRQNLLLVQRMECLFILEWLDSLKQTVVTNFFSRR